LARHRNIDDANIVAALREGAPDAANLLFAHYYKRLLSAIKRKFSWIPTMELEELASDAILAAINKIHMYEYIPGKRLIDWLYVILRNKTISYLRKEYKLTFVSFDPQKIEWLHACGQCSSPYHLSSIGKYSEASMVSPLFAEFFRNLSQRDQLILRTRRAGHTYREVAAMADVSEANARQIFSRRMRRFQKVLDSKSRIPTGSPQP
jgi:RNA polymerase sigma factor (sigma-70 family)